MTQGISTQTLTNGNGGLNWFGIIVFVATLLVVFFTAYQIYLSVQSLKKEESNNDNKLHELEINIRNILGDKYKTIT